MTQISNVEAVRSRWSHSTDNLQIIEISSDSEDDVSTIQKENRTCSPQDNNVIELTDSDLSDSDLPDMLFPLVKGPRRKGVTCPRKQLLSSEDFIPLYIDVSGDEGSDKDCILVLNDPLGSRKPIQATPPSKGISQGVARVKPLLEFPKSAVPEISQVVQKSHSKRTGRSAYEAMEQARRQNYATELFAELNKTVFGDRLPKNTDIEWSKRLLTTAGRAHWRRSREGGHTTKIELASKILDCDERIRNTLSHEMCHLACWVIDDQPREGHGQLFKSWARKVMHKRPDIHISTRHTYEISYPYEWKCEGCSKIYGRYSKSIRPDECVCGCCKSGKLIPLFVERKTTTPKINRVAVAKLRDSPSSAAGGPPTKGPVIQPSIDLDDEDILGLADALGCIAIDSTRAK